MVAPEKVTSPTTSQPTLDVSSKVDYEHYLTPYLEHSKTLRTWFVAYGIGGPILFASQKLLIEKLIDYNCIKSVVTMMLFGTLLQILLTFISKMTSYQFYLSEIYDPHVLTRMHRLSINISKHYHWLLPLIDFITIILFVWATVLVFLAWS